MKAITLTQPWATLVAMAEKRYETRSWATSYRGPLAIHAAKGFASIGGKHGYQHLLGSDPFFEVVGQHVLHTGQPLPTGAIIAVAQLAAVYPCDESLRRAVNTGMTGAKHEPFFGDFSLGRYAWDLANVQMLTAPVPIRGALGLWDVPTRFYLCCNCGVITDTASWTYWQREDDTDGRGQHWRPSLDGEYDPMCRCPECGYEHKDDDSGPGLFDGGLLELDAQRDDLRPDFASDWAEAQAA